MCYIKFQFKAAVWTFLVKNYPKLIFEQGLCVYETHVSEIKLYSGFLNAFWLQLA